MLLDCIRWNSQVAMIMRFLRAKDRINKALDEIVPPKSMMKHQNIARNTIDS